MNVHDAAGRRFVRTVCLLLVLLGTSMCSGGVQICALHVALDTDDGRDRVRCRLASYDGTAEPPSIVHGRADGRPIEIPVSDVPCGGSRQVVLEVSCEGYAPLRSGPHAVTAGRVTCADADIGRLMVRRLDARTASLDVRGTW